MINVRSLKKRVITILAAAALVCAAVPARPAAVRADNYQFLTGIRLDGGTDGYNRLVDDGYRVMGTGLNSGVPDEEQVWIGVQLNDGSPVTNVIIAPYAGDSYDADDGFRYLSAGHVDIDEGSGAGAGCVYYTVDPDAGEPLVGLDIIQSDPKSEAELLTITNDGAEIVRTAEGAPADLEARRDESPMYLAMIRDGLVRPYVREVALVSGEDRAAAVYEAAVLGFHYYADGDLDEDADRYTVLAYNRTADPDEAITHLAAVTEDLVLLLEEGQITAADLAEAEALNNPAEESPAEETGEAPGEALPEDESAEVPEGTAEEEGPGEEPEEAFPEETSEEEVSQEQEEELPEEPSGEAFSEAEAEEENPEEAAEEEFAEPAEEEFTEPAEEELTEETFSDEAAEETLPEEEDGEALPEAFSEEASEEAFSEEEEDEALTEETAEAFPEDTEEFPEETSEEELPEAVSEEEAQAEPGEPQSAEEDGAVPGETGEEPADSESPEASPAEEPGEPLSGDALDLSGIRYERVMGDPVGSAAPWVLYATKDTRAGNPISMFYAGGDAESTESLFGLWAYGYFSAKGASRAYSYIINEDALEALRGDLTVCVKIPVVQIGGTVETAEGTGAVRLRTEETYLPLSFLTQKEGLPDGRITLNGLRGAEQSAADMTGMAEEEADDSLNSSAFSSKGAPVLLGGGIIALAALIAGALAVRRRKAQDGPDRRKPSSEERRDET